MTGAAAVEPAPAASPSSARDLFVTLFTTWSHSPIATLSLCLLAQAYELACFLVAKLYVELGCVALGGLGCGRVG